MNIIGLFGQFSRAERICDFFEIFPTFFWIHLTHFLKTLITFIKTLNRFSIKWLLSFTLLSKMILRFEYRSFSFNEDYNGSQKLSCNIKFCLKDNNACLAQLKSNQITCEPGILEYVRATDLLWVINSLEKIQNQK